jgi:hypothetical protein
MRKLEEPAFLFPVEGKRGEKKTGKLKGINGTSSHCCTFSQLTSVSWKNHLFAGHGFTILIATQNQGSKDFLMESRTLSIWYQNASFQIR